MTTLLILLGLLALLFAGVPVAFALGGLGVVLLWLVDVSPVMMVQALYSTTDNFVLLAVPMFLLMSHVLLKGGVGRDLFNAVQSWVGHWPGGLGVATLISCGIFSAISGSSVATAATIATVAIPEMIERGYKRSFVFGLLAAGGTLGILIPPSIPMILYGVITEESIVSLFLAGIGPGLLLLVVFIVFSMAYAHFGGGYKPTPKADWRTRFQTGWTVLPMFALGGVILGGLYSGVFTPTESAGVGFVLSLIIVSGRRSMTWPKLKEAVLDSMRTTASIFLIVAGANVFSKAITLYRIPQDVSLALGATIGDAGLFVLLVCAVLLVIGCFLESITMILLMVPVLHPSLAGLGIDPILFGVIFVVMIECALITPPVGLNLFVIQAIANVRMSEVLTGVWPFVLMMLATIAALYAMPDIVLFIPFRL